MSSSGEYHLILFVCMAVTDGWANAISVTLNESTVLLGMTQTLSQTTHVIWLCCCHLKKTLKYVNKRIPHCHQFKSYLKAAFAASVHCQGRGHFVTGPLCHLPGRPLPSLGPGCWHSGAIALNAPCCLSIIYTRAVLGSDSISIPTTITKEAVLVFVERFGKCVDAGGEYYKKMK